MRFRAKRAGTTLIAIAAATAIASGCGGGQTFEAQEFVDQANDNGATLVLGETLTSSDPDLTVYSLSAESTDDGKKDEEEVVPPVGTTGFQGATGPNGAIPEIEEGSGGGSLIVAPDPDKGLDEYERCEATLSLLCYRVANIVLVFESLEPEQRAQLDAAVVALGNETED